MSFALETTDLCYPEIDWLRVYADGSHVDKTNIRKQEMCIRDRYWVHLIQTFLTKHGILQVYQVPYSPDMDLCDFWLFLKIKNTLKESCFESCEEIMLNVIAQLHAITKEAFQDCFQRWKDCWTKHVESQGAYFEAVSYTHLDVYKRQHTHTHTHRVVRIRFEPLKPCLTWLVQKHSLLCTK